MARNPFRKPYVFSKKWAIWSALVIPYSVYANLTAPGAKSSDAITAVLVACVFFVLVPWAFMRIRRALQGKTPQGKYYYGQDGDVVDGEVLNLKLGYWPRVKIQAQLIDGVVEIPTGKIAVGDIKSIKAKDPRPLFIKIPLNIFRLIYGLIYLYFLLQPLLLLTLFEIPDYVQKLFNGQQIISRDQMYEELLKIKFFAYMVHSQALLQPFLIVLSIVLIGIILKPFIDKNALVIKTNDGNSLYMPFSTSLNPYIMLYVEGKRLRRFIKKVKKAQKRSRKSADE
ncbi:unannotated protein [freshwater metagenome]|jgi:hypothetical protein|uniref:Unannotated protein n=1 Tax=freshwater metagenome TaxID=449393 RepID=A0A6J6LNC1_9ZZZZ|nr:hypothetical protein [Actinomycetota bacterium]MTA47735.1 hypothetical protein [Actinomycetota bacterium]